MQLVQPTDVWKSLGEHSRCSSFNSAADTNCQKSIELNKQPALHLFLTPVGDHRTIAASARPRKTRDVHNEQSRGPSVFRRKNQKYKPPPQSLSFLTHHHFFQTPTRHSGPEPVRKCRKSFSTKNSVPTRASAQCTSCGMPAFRAKTIHV